MGGKEIEEFYRNLAVEENVAASTQNQALRAIASQKKTGKMPIPHNRRICFLILFNQKDRLL
jgi:hypothetical protein